MSLSQIRADFVVDGTETKSASLDDRRPAGSGGVLSFESQPDKPVRTPIKRPSVVHNQLSTSHKEDFREMRHTAQPEEEDLGN